MQQEDESVVSEPTPEELAALSAALDEATAAALRVVESMERTSELIQDCIAELRAANREASAIA